MVIFISISFSPSGSYYFLHFSDSACLSMYLSSLSLSMARRFLAIITLYRLISPDLNLSTDLSLKGFQFYVSESVMSLSFLALLLSYRFWWSWRVLVIRTVFYIYIYTLLNPLSLSLSRFHSISLSASPHLVGQKLLWAKHRAKATWFQSFVPSCGKGIPRIFLAWS